MGVKNKRNNDRGQIKHRQGDRQTAVQMYGDVGRLFTPRQVKSASINADRAGKRGGGKEENKTSDEAKAVAAAAAVRIKLHPNSTPHRKKPI